MHPWHHLPGCLTDGVLRQKYPCWGAGMSPGLPRCRFWDALAAAALPQEKRAPRTRWGEGGGAGEPQPCATLTWGQTQHPPQTRGSLRAPASGQAPEAWKQPGLSWSDGAGRSSAGAMSRGTAACGDVPISLFPTGPALVPPSLQLSPHRGCLRFPLGRKRSLLSFLHRGRAISVTSS